MAGEDLLNYTGQAAIAYQDALNQAKFAQNALLRQYGFTAPSASGEYTVEGAQAAFDPNTLFDKATGGIDRARLGELSAGLRVGGTGRLADIMRSGASGEAEAAMEVRQRLGEGIGGGLMSQRRGLAEQLAAGELGAAKSEFISGLGQALSPISSAYQGLQSAQIQDRLAAEEAAAYKNSLAKPIDFTTSQPEPKVESGGYAKLGTPGGKPPSTPKGGELYTGPGGTKWQYRMNGPSGKGWYKK